MVLVTMLETAEEKQYLTDLSLFYHLNRCIIIYDAIKTMLLLPRVDWIHKK